MFKNPPGDSAGRLIEAAALKGRQQGEAQVSWRHANFIVNRGQAQARDVLRLMRVIRQRVQRQSGVLLEPEVRFWGCSLDPRSRVPKVVQKMNGLARKSFFGFLLGDEEREKIMYLGKTKLGVAGRNGFHRPLKEGEANWFQRLGHHFWIGSIIVMILVGLSITLLVGYLVALSTPFFRLEDVNFQGNKQVSQVELLQKGGLEDKLNILSLNLSDVKKKMEAIPWVKSVQLRRELPNKLLVSVQERQPLSLVLVNGGLYFLDREGIGF